jgi:hypothetical protein
MQRRAIIPLFLSTLAGPASAHDPVAWVGAPDCRLAMAASTTVQAVEWSGQCKDGLAEGKGTLAWTRDGKRFVLEATFGAGQVQGEGRLRYPVGTVYKGSFHNALPDGRGYFQYADGAQYEGDVRMGLRDGTGEELYRNGNDYNGQWKHGQREGNGTLTYQLGGRYEGGWKNDRPSGPGKIVYAGTPGREAAVVDGRLPGAAATASGAAGAATTDAADAAADTAAGTNNAPGRPAYTLREDAAHVDTLFRRDIAHGIPVPPGAGYDELTAAQKTIVNSWFPALAPGDEPPYPLHGPKEFYNVMARVVSKTHQHGTIYVAVTVGKDGKAVNVTAVGLDDPEVRKFVATAAGLVQYKPARCAGEPCEMGYGYNLNLTMAL